MCGLISTCNAAVEAANCRATKNTPTHTHTQIRSAGSQTARPPNDKASANEKTERQQQQHATNFVIKISYLSDKRNWRKSTGWREEARTADARLCWARCPGGCFAAFACICVALACGGCVCVRQLFFVFNLHKTTAQQ